MAAGQQKKRLHASSVVSCDLQKHCGTKKKKKLVSPHIFLNLKAHISLLWDENEQKVVAKREQIGISWRNLGPSISPLPMRHDDTLADVIFIPHEVFGLEDMTEVLCHEVWEVQLSETERNFLSQFLPDGQDADQVVRALLTGENLHFGNPFLKWGASLCSGKLHPDAILCQEQRVAAQKKAYDVDLQKYHNEYLNDNMVQNLQKLRKAWASCEGPERDIVENMWRIGHDKCRNIYAASERPKVSTHSKKEEKPQRLYVRSGNGAKYMSYFKITRRQHQLVKGMEQPDGIKFKCLNSVLGDIKSFRVQPYEVYEEEERKKLHEHWLRLVHIDLPSAFTNWTKSSSQRQHWIRTLDHEIKEKINSDYEEEEGSPHSLLQEERDIGDADAAVMHISNCETDKESTSQFSNGRPIQRIPSLNTHQVHEPMTRELEDGNQELFKPDGSSSPVMSKLVGDSNLPELLHRIPSPNGHGEIEPMSTDSDESSQEIVNPEGSSPVLPMFVGERNPSNVFGQKVFSHSAKGYVSCSTDSHPLQRIPSLNGHHELDVLEMEYGVNIQDITKPDVSLSSISQFAGNMNLIEDTNEHQICLHSAKDAWLEVGLPDSYYHLAPTNHGYTTSRELSHGQPKFTRERSVPLVDPEIDLVNGDAKGILLDKPSDGMRSGFNIDIGGSFSSSYTNQDHNELFQPLFRRQGQVLSQANNQKQVGLQFLGTHNMSLETGHHHGHLLEQQQRLLEQRQQNGDGNYYMHHIINKNMYTNSGRYPIPSQEFFPPVNMQNWAVDSTQGLSTPLQTHSVGRDLLSENTSMVENQVRGGWSGVDVSSSRQCLLGNRSNTDGSLYSVLSEFNKSQPHPYGLMGTPEQGFGARNIVGGGINNYGNAFPLTGGHEVGIASKSGNTSWTNLPHENSTLRDSIAQPFLKSWNR